MYRQYNGGQIEDKTEIKTETKIEIWELNSEKLRIDKNFESGYAEEILLNALDYMSQNDFENVCRCLKGYKQYVEKREGYEVGYVLFDSTLAKQLSGNLLTLAQKKNATEVEAVLKDMKAVPVPVSDLEIQNFQNSSYNQSYNGGVNTNNINQSNPVNNLQPQPKPQPQSYNGVQPPLILSTPQPYNGGQPQTSAVQPKPKASNTWGAPKKPAFGPYKG